VLILTNVFNTKMVHLLNASLWIAQGLVAAVIALTGAAKLALPRENLADRMHWAAECAVRTHRRLGEGFLPAVVVGALCLGIAGGRLFLGTKA